jgi:hypothetical protein
MVAAFNTPEGLVAVVSVAVGLVELELPGIGDMPPGTPIGERLNIWFHIPSPAP